MPCLMSWIISSSNSPDLPILCMPMTYKPSKRESLKISTRCPVFVSIPMTEKVMQHLLVYTFLACVALIKIDPAVLRPVLLARTSCMPGAYSTGCAEPSSFCKEDLPLLQFVLSRRYCPQPTCARAALSAVSSHARSQADLGRTGAASTGHT